MALEDLNLKDTSSKDLGGYFLVTITDLDLATQYPIQFQYVYADGRQNKNWSAGKYFTTVGATVPNEPQLESTDVVGGAGFIKVTWSGNDATGNPIENFDRVDVHISGTTFGDGTKPAGSFRSASTQTFTCVPGIYIVQLKVYSLNGTTSFFSSGQTVTVSEVTEPIQTPIAPSSGGFTSRRILGGIEVTWDGTYSSAWTGFEAINIYAGTSSAATGGTYTKVGQMTANKVTNKIVVPVDGTYVRYNQPVYIHASSVNKNQAESSIVANVTSQSLGAGQATDSDINDGAVVISKLASNVLTVDNLKAGNINSTSYIRAGSGSTGARVEISSSTVGSVNPGLYIYNSGGTAVFSAPLSGGLSITGALTATSISTNSGNFSVNSSGILTANSADINGTIKATSGYIGGTTSGIYIASGAIQNNAGASNFKIDSDGKARFGSATGNAIVINPTSGNGGYYLYHTTGGQDGSASSKFNVATDGTLTASNANITGNITANAIAANTSITGTTGTFGPTTLDSSGITSTNFSVTSSGVNITGSINADSGRIGNASTGWTIDPDGTLHNGTLTYLYPKSISGNSVSFAMYSDRGILVIPGTGSSFGYSAFGTNLVTYNGTSPHISSSAAVRINDAFAPNADNTYSLGFTDARWQIVRSAGGVSTTSDQRLKTDIQDSTLGLNFINLLRPVSFKMISGGKIYEDDKQKEVIDNKVIEPKLIDRPGVRTHWGLLAQNVKEAIDILNIEDFAGWQLDDKDDPNSGQSLVHHEFLGPIIKAIQELSARLDALEA